LDTIKIIQGNDHLALSAVGMKKAHGHIHAPARRSRRDPRPSPTFGNGLDCVEQVKKDDDGDRYTEQPQQDAFHDDSPMNTEVSGEC